MECAGTAEGETGLKPLWRPGLEPAAFGTK